MSNVFRFKKFEVSQNNVGAKVGTDGVLLGAWTPINEKYKNYLDIGTGTGVIALILAQRSRSIIDAIDIDNNACKTASFNFEQSIWKDNLNLLKGDFLEYPFTKKYDCIVSNPPFYKNIFPIDNQQRNFARNESSLSFEHLINKVSSILSPFGIFSVIIPFEYEQEFILLAEKVKLFAKKILRVKGNINSKIKRSLICFSFDKFEVEEDLLIIEEQRHIYTQKYIDLVKNFYLKM
ncbi:methyltransferase [Weeksellaceae bacterium TAE3-ERU29]|nr:methyltransferase [Weeksellaceae bacterium TAE3-ERU29]